MAKKRQQQPTRSPEARWATPTSHTGALDTLLKALVRGAEGTVVGRPLTPYERLAATTADLLQRARVIVVTGRQIRYVIDTILRENVDQGDLLRWLAKQRLPDTARPVYYDLSTAARPNYAQMTLLRTPPYVTTVAGLLVDRAGEHVTCTPFGSGIKGVTYREDVAGAPIRLVGGPQTSGFADELLNGYDGGPIPPIAPLGQLRYGPNPDPVEEYMGQDGKVNYLIQFGVTLTELPDTVADHCSVSIQHFGLERGAGSLLLSVGDTARLAQYPPAQRDRIIAKWAEVLGRQVALAAALLYVLSNTGIEVREEPTPRPPGSSKKAATTESLVVRIRPSTRRAGTTGDTGTGSPHAVQTVRSEHWNHFRAPTHPHVRCPICRGESAGPPCWRCKGTGLDRDQVSDCLRRDRRTGELTCPDGCRKEWIGPVVVGPEDAPLVRKVAELRP